MSSSNSTPGEVAPVKPLKFMGYSDDTFGEHGRTNDDFDCCASGKAIIYRLTHRVGDHVDGMFVFGQYAGRDWPKQTPGCWMIGVQQLDEDLPFPWPMRFEHEGYTPILVIDAPPDVEIECLNRRDSGE